MGFNSAFKGLIWSISNWCPFWDCQTIVRI